MSDPSFDLEVLARQSVRVGALARRLVADAHLAEDVAQESMMRALQARESGAPRSMSGWLATVTRNVAASWHRSRTRRERLVRELARPSVEPGTDQIAERIERQRM